MYISFLNIETTDHRPKIGTDVQYCPHCSKPLSFSDNRPFCRNCQAEVKAACEKYKKIISADKSWLQRHIGDEFPYPEACWICKRGDCVGCEVLNDG